MGTLRLLNDECGHGVAGGGEPGDIEAGCILRPASLAHLSYDALDAVARHPPHRTGEALEKAAADICCKLLRTPLDQTLVGVLPLLPRRGRCPLPRASAPTGWSERRVTGGVPRQR